ncbi:hypothetical protein ACJZ2D_011467 [Fusarium nematophilum]
MSFVHPSSLEEAVQDKSLIRTGAFVADQWVQGDKTFSVFDPEIGNPIAQIADVGHDDILKAIAYAKAGFDSFRKTSEYAREKLLHDWASLIRKPWRESRQDTDHGEWQDPCRR